MSGGYLSGRCWTCQCQLKQGDRIDQVDIGEGISYSLDNNESLYGFVCHMCYELTKLVQDNQFSDITETMQRSLGFVSRWGFKAVTVACENAEVDSPHSLYLYLSSKREKANENQ